jgi:hypothetical protein
MEKATENKKMINNKQNNGIYIVVKWFYNNYNIHKGEL